MNSDKDQKRRTVENSGVEFICQKSDIYETEMYTTVIFCETTASENKQTFSVCDSIFLKYLCKIDQMSCPLKC